MDWKTSLDWYCSGNKLDDDDIECLEVEYQQILKANKNEVKVEVAPKHICNQIGIQEGSLWIKAVAVVLDRISPGKIGSQRCLIIDKIRKTKHIQPLVRQVSSSNIAATKQRSQEGEIAIG